MRFRQNLLKAAPAKCSLIFCDSLNESPLDSALGYPRTSSLDYLVKSKWRLIRFCSGVAQIDFIYFINYLNLRENQPGSALGWPRPSSSEFLLKSKWKSFRFCSYVCLCLVWLFGLRPCLFGKYEPIRLSRFGLIDWLASLFPMESKLNNYTALPVPVSDQVLEHLDWKSLLKRWKWPIVIPTKSQS